MLYLLLTLGMNSFSAYGRQNHFHPPQLYRNYPFLIIYIGVFGVTSWNSHKHPSPPLLFPWPEIGDFDFFGEFCSTPKTPMYIFISFFFYRNYNFVLQASTFGSSLGYDGCYRNTFSQRSFCYGCGWT